MLKKLFGLLTIISFVLPAQVLATTENVSDLVSEIVYIDCGAYTGSGVILSDQVVLTNAHVVEDDYGEVVTSCFGGYVENAYETPELTLILTPSLVQHDDYFDYAFLEVTDLDSNGYNFPSYAVLGNADSMILGEEIVALGYPDSTLTGSTITSTQGTVSGFSGTNWIKSDITIEHGNSGGGVFDSLGNYIGIPTSVSVGELNSYSWIQNINAVFEDAYGTDVFVRDSDTLYERGNQVCFSDSCYYYAADEDDYSEYYSLSGPDSADSTVDDDSDVITSDSVSPPTAGVYVPEKYDASLVGRLLGRILLQVEENGEAWYVNPADSYRYYMANGSVAYSMMRSFSLGITDADLENIMVAGNTTDMLDVESICDGSLLANQLKGKILLQVEQHGEAWYVHPDKCYRIYLKDGDAAYDIMKFLSLGITNSDLEKMPSGSL